MNNLLKLIRLMMCVMTNGRYSCRAIHGIFFLFFLVYQDNGRSVPDLTASPGRAPHPGPGPMQSNQQHGNMQRQGGVKEPVLLQGDFRKVSGISSEIFRQIEAVENDHDPSTAAALDVIIGVYKLRCHSSLLFDSFVGCRKTRRDDCEGVGAKVHRQPSLVRGGPKVSGEGRFSAHSTNGGDCEASWTDFG